jgi:hypothetical protein
MPSASRADDMRKRAKAYGYKRHCLDKAKAQRKRRDGRRSGSANQINRFPRLLIWRENVSSYLHFVCYHPLENSFLIEFYLIALSGILAKTYCDTRPK